MSTSLRKSNQVLPANLRPYMYYSFFWTGLNDPIACSLLGGGSPSQNSGYKITRLFPFIFRLLVFPSSKDGSGPPLQDSHGFPALQCNFPTSSIFPPITSSPSIFVQSTVLLQQLRLSPVVCPSEVYNLPTDCRPIPCSLFPVQRTDV